MANQFQDFAKGAVVLTAQVHHCTAGFLRHFSPPEYDAGEKCCFDTCLIYLQVKCLVVAGGSAT